jgi:formylglycine-generating enzyme required for sulfatase activity
MLNSKNRNAEHNLILAGLGLQLGIIAKDKVIRAFTEWLFDKSRPLGEILVHQKAITPEQRKTLESAVEAHIQQEGGEQKALASLNHVKDLESDLDHLADNDLNQSLDGAVTQRKLMGLDVLFSQSHDSESSSTNKKGSFSGPESKQTDRFERQHFLDSGNLGEVFFAKDTELNRTVVTKYIRPEMSGDTFKQALFHLEGEVTGSLEHPSVVPVYGLGKDTKGRLYYAMRYIRGKKLSRVIAEYHCKEAGLKQEALTGLLQNFQAVCLAIEYAHSKGVLHCDIKPDNIMIGDYGEVFVVDWGLVVVCGDAKSPSEIHQMETLDQSIIPPYKPSELASSGLHEQQGGSRRGVGGTPAYMAPEQFTATMSEDISLVTPKADIYALGSTLYHILTGKAPHLPKEGVKESPDVFYFRITTGMIPTPREKDSSIPKLLEQIVLKAMQVEPEDRYASARELAEDIKRFVSDEPVHAYQESGLEKSRRWIRKNRALVGAAMVMLLLVAMVSIGFVIMFAQFNKQLTMERDRANSNEELAKDNEKHAKDNEELAKQKLADIKKMEDYKLKVIQIADKLEMVLIPPGKFKMGSPITEVERDKGETQHEVTLTKHFYMGKYEVTQEQWESVMGKNPSRGDNGTKLPVTDVSWEDCQEFIKKLNASTKGGYRLPYEAEWEYACRAGTTTAYSYGASLTESDANIDGDSIKEVGSYKPNAFGLYDMHGNVWEWSEDGYADYPAGAVTDPMGPATGYSRVLRGGSFYLNESNARSSFRGNDFSPTFRSSVTGFRLARTMNIEGLSESEINEFLLKVKKEEEAKTKREEEAKAKKETEAKVKKEAEEAKAKEAQKKAAMILNKEVEEKTEVGKNINLEMVLIPAGKFMMGSPVSEKNHKKDETEYEVTLTKPYYIGKYEVTQEQWQEVMGNNPSKIKGAKLPVTDVSWKDCQEFIKKLNAKTNGGYRLPTEAEWEYACRAGTSTAYSFGDSLKDSDANIKGDSIEEVGSYKPNAFGLYDMHGNVWEWCEDWYGDYPEGAVTDPKGPATGDSRVLRGGSFGSNDSTTRSSIRYDSTPPLRGSDDGFRLARTP